MTFQAIWVMVVLMVSVLSTFSTASTSVSNVTWNPNHDNTCQAVQVTTKSKIALPTTVMPPSFETRTFPGPPGPSRATTKVPETSPDSALPSTSAVQVDFSSKQSSKASLNPTIIPTAHSALGSMTATSHQTRTLTTPVAAFTSKPSPSVLAESTSVGVSTSATSTDHSTSSVSGSFLPFFPFVSRGTSSSTSTTTTTTTTTTTDAPSTSSSPKSTFRTSTSTTSFTTSGTTTLPLSTSTPTRQSTMTTLLQSTSKSTGAPLGPISSIAPPSVFQGTGGMIEINYSWCFLLGLGWIGAFSTI